MVLMPSQAFAGVNLQKSMDEAKQWVSGKLLGVAAGAYNEAPPFSFTYGGKPSAELLKTWTVERTAKALDDQRTQRVITCTDPATGLQVRCEAMQYLDYPAVEWTVYFKNTGQADTPIIENIYAIDTKFPRGKPGYQVLHYFDGGYAGPNAYGPHEVSLAKENQYQAFNPNGRGSDRYMPYFNLEYGTGGAIMAIGWPGQWKMEFRDVQNWEQRAYGGQELTHFLLHPGEEVRTPLIAMLFWQDGDWIDSQNLWRRWMIVHSTPNHDGKPLPPQSAGCSSGIYNEMLNANEENQKFFIDTYLANGLKIDYWWMDAGWYYNNGRWDNTGTWEVDLKRFPKGLRAVTDHAHAKGVKAIVWFEPERVTSGTWLWENHPEWLIGTDGKNRLLNLGIPEAKQWLIEHTDHLLVEQGIDLYREDFNINPLPYWRNNDSADRQGITEIRYVEGHLAYWDELRRRHPGMLIDSCSSGGRRNDLETMRRAVPLLRSDDIAFPLSEQGHTYGISLWIPYFGTGMPLDSYGFRSAMGWHLTMGPDARDTKFDYTEARTLFNQWRQIAPYFIGDFYPLTPYSLSEYAWMGWQYNRPEQTDGLLVVFRHAMCPDASNRLRLRGLQPEARYRLTDIDTQAAQEMTGKQLMDEGCPVMLPDRPSAKVIRYQRIGE
jgi:alpha-galactosidase